MKIFNTIFGKIFLGIVATVIAIVVTMTVFTSYKISQGFDVFLYQQRQMYGSGWRRNTDTNSEESSREGITAVNEERYQQIIDEFQTTINQSILFASLLGIAASVAIGYVISRQLAKPLHILRNQLHQASKNNYQHLKTKGSSSEIKELVQQFNKLIDELNRVELLRGNLVSDVTHELKTPLTKVVGQLEGCIDGVYKCDTDHLRKILGNVEQLTELISDLQALVEIKAGKINLKLSQVNLSSLINSVISGYSKPTVKIVNTVDPHATISADKSRLREVLDNLISNAIRHTEKGEVNISLNSGAKLVIADTGVGIHEQDLPYVFERFYRADKSRSKDTGGLGLGLAIVKEIVELHGWKIEVKSKLGKGTQFIITIPN